jgi:Protein of unknown function (DUF3306)
MSDDDNFLARWSRRKRDTARESREQLKPENDGGDVTSGASVSSSETKPPFDPASLPPIESIGAGSDIRAFLAAGVPADLTRAALRRVWQSDPKIRDFIGLSENSWDFNAPGAMAGFGPIDKEEVGRLLTQLLREPDATPAAANSSIVSAQPDKAATHASESGPVEENQFTAGATGSALAGDQRQLDSAETADDVTRRPKARSAPQDESASCGNRPPRGHGGALPK